VEATNLIYIEVGVVEEMYYLAGGNGLRLPILFLFFATVVEAQSRRCSAPGRVASSQRNASQLRHFVVFASLGGHTRTCAARLSSFDHAPWIGFSDPDVRRLIATVAPSVDRHSIDKPSSNFLFQTCTSSNCRATREGAARQPCHSMTPGAARPP
jgi:hypothetical protein